MSVLFQILFGSTILVGCTLIHIAIMVWLVGKLQSRKIFLADSSVERIFIISSGVVFVLLLSHTLHLYIWALALWVLGALPGHEEPIYFALVTYTTVGYGDVTLGPAFRVFGSMAAVNGTLSFGLTTAFLVALFPRLFVVLRDKI
ncbi:MAG: ion channel [Roseobacter sp.]